MDTDRLRHLKVVIETGHLRRAAQLLGISHGGLSKSLKTLADELQVKLFHQRGRTLEPTPEGMRIYRKLPNLLAQIDALREGDGPTASGQASAAPLVRIGTFEVFSTYFMGQLLADTLKDYRLRLHECVPGEVEEYLLADRIDYGITYLPVSRPGVLFEKISRVEMAVFARQGSFADTATDQLPFAVPITPVVGSPTGIRGLDGWPDHLFTRKIVFEVTLMETALELCRQGVAAAFLPAFIARLHNARVTKEFRLTERTLPRGMKAVSRDAYLVRRQGSPEDRLEIKLAKAMRTIQTGSLGST